MQAFDFDKMLDHPIVFPSSTNSKPCHQWTFQSLSEELQDKKLTCRVWGKCNKQILETCCDHINVSMKEFCAWLQSKVDDSNPLKGYDRSTHAAYIDYKYMKDVFSDCPQKLQEVQWNDFGLSSFDGKDSTLWIGSEGANTPGHQDSYGFNLVSQIAGRKMWILFPPSDTNYLYPTRVPYEESSVFTQVHIGYPDIDKHPALKMSHPLVVILHPGQTLYVPRHWWHYVESLDPSISINVWVPHKDDSDSHLTESLTRYLATSLLSDTKSKTDALLCSQLLNPTETLCSQPENIGFIQCAVERVLRPSLSRDANNYLGKFDSWLVNSCRISHAPMDPCLGLCHKHDGYDLHGCITRTDFPAFDEDGKRCVCNVDVRIGDKQYERTNGKGDGPTLCKRSSELELYERELKRCKSNDGAYTSIGIEESSACDKSPFESATVWKEGEIPPGQMVYSLAHPFSFDQFLHLMRVKHARDAVEAKSYPLASCAQCKLVQQRHASHCSERENRRHLCNEIIKNCSGFSAQYKRNVQGSSSPLIHQPSSLSCSSMLSSSPPPSSSDNHPHCPESLLTQPDLGMMNAYLLESSVTSKIENKGVNECVKPVLNRDSHQDPITVSNTRTDNDSDFSTKPSSLSERDVQQFLFESVLHPSVVERIASVFKIKCENVLKQQRVEMEVPITESVEHRTRTAMPKDCVQVPSSP